MKLNADEVARLAHVPDPFPSTTPDPYDPDRFEQWQKLVDYVMLRAGVPGGWVAALAAVDALKTQAHGLFAVVFCLP